MKPIAVLTPCHHLTLVQLQQRKGPKKEYSGNKREMKEKEELEKVAASPAVCASFLLFFSERLVKKCIVRYEEWCSAAQAQVQCAVTCQSTQKCNNQRSGRSNSLTSPMPLPFSKV